MTPKELLEHIQSGPDEIELDFALCFRPRSRSNEYDDFNDLLQALRSNQTIRVVECHSHKSLGITESEWCRLLLAFASILCLKNLVVAWENGSLDFHPLQVIAESVDSASSLEELFIASFGSDPADPIGEVTLAQSLRHHGTLKDLNLWARTQTTTRIPLIIEAAVSSSSVRRVVCMNQTLSPQDIRSLVRSPSLKELKLEGSVDSWLVVAEEIRNGRFHLEELALTRTLISCTLATTEALKAMIAALGCDSSLRKLVLGSTTGFTDQMGVALAKALTVNTTLREIHLSSAYKTVDGLESERPLDHLDVASYKAFALMAKTNTAITMGLPLLKSDASDETRMQRDRLHIEGFMNEAGRGRLVTSSTTTRTEWVNALDILNDSTAEEDGPEFHLSCLYSMLQLNPSIFLGDFTAPAAGAPSV